MIEAVIDDFLNLQRPVAMDPGLRRDDELILRLAP
jgi:hypothetical protein